MAYETIVPMPIDADADIASDCSSMPPSSELTGLAAILNSQLISALEGARAARVEQARIQNEIAEFLEFDAESEEAELRERLSYRELQELAELEAEIERCVPSDPIEHTPPPAPKTAKTTKNPHRKSSSRDARFHEQRQIARAAHPTIGGAGTSVCSVSKPFLKITRRRGSTTLSSTTALTPTPSPKRRSKCASWRDQDKGLGGHTRHSVAPAWRDLSFPGLIQELSDTLMEEGHAVAITARLSPEIEAKALAASSTTTYIEQRIKHELRVSHRAGRLSAVPDFFLVLEQVHGRDTHMHGLIGAPHGDLAEIRLCFRRACGEWKVARQHQVQTDENPDDGWTSYLLKDRAKQLKLVRALKIAAGDRMSVTYSGRPYTVTTGLRRRAQGRYEGHRLMR